MRSTEEILQDALALPATARAAIAGSLLESLDDDDHAVIEQVEEQWAAEVERRMADLDAGRVQSVPWSEVRQRLFEE